MSQQQQQDQHCLSFDEVEYELRKRLPPRYPKSKNHIYITRHTSLKSQMKRIEKLLENDYDEVVVHGIGAAISRTINVALAMQRKLSNTLNIHIITGTLKVTDDLYPLYDEIDFKSRNRSISAVHIRLARL